MSFLQMGYQKKYIFIVALTPTPRRGGGGGGRAADSDGDGWSDSYEIRKGTDPHDVTSYPGAPSPTPTPSGFEAVFVIVGLLAVAYLVLRIKK